MMTTGSLAATVSPLEWKPEVLRCQYEQNFPICDNLAQTIVDVKGTSRREGRSHPRFNHAQTGQESGGLCCSLAVTLSGECTPPFVRPNIDRLRGCGVRHPSIGCPHLGLLPLHRRLYITQAVDRCLGISAAAVVFPSSSS
jgi:hypothetical protein